MQNPNDPNPMSMRPGKVQPRASGNDTNIMHVGLCGRVGQSSDSRVEDLIALLFMCFKSGDTAEQHSLKTHELLDKLQRSEADGGFGQTISLDLLCRIFFCFQDFGPKMSCVWSNEEKW